MQLSQKNNLEFRSQVGDPNHSVRVLFLCKIDKKNISEMILLLFNNEHEAYGILGTWDFGDMFSKILFLHLVGAKTEFMMYVQKYKQKI